MVESEANSPLIGIDASSVVGERTGIGYATACLLNAYACCWPEDWSAASIWVNSPRHELPADDAWRNSPRLQVKHTRMPGRALLRGWQYINWPPIERMVGPAQLVHAPASYIPAVQRARRVVTVHDVYFKYAPEHVQTYGGTYFDQTFTRGLPTVDHIITVSQFTRQELLKFYEVDPARVSVIYPGLDHDRFNSRTHDDDEENLRSVGLEPPYLLCVAMLEPRKNLITMIEGYARALQILRAGRQRTPRLAIVGPSGWSSDALRARIQEAGLENMVELTGYVPDAVLPSLYRKAFALVFPSVYEGFGMPVLEAMACGCPVVLSNAGALPEVAEDSGVYFNPRSSDSIARTLAKFIIDPHLRSYMRASGLTRAKHFDWLHCARATLDVYRHVLGLPIEQTPSPMAQTTPV